MPAKEKEPIERSALLVIDVQDSFRADPGRWARRSNPRFEENLARLVDAYREAELPVIWVLHTDDDSAFRQDSPWFRVQAWLEPREGEPVLVKTTRNAFTSTSLAEVLAGLGVRRLAVTGIQTEQCCETTARLAGDLGYDVDFVTEATATFPIRNPATGEELGVEEITRNAEFALRGRFARIATVDELVGEMALVPAA